MNWNMHKDHRFHALLPILSIIVGVTALALGSYIIGYVMVELGIASPYSDDPFSLVFEKGFVGFFTIACILLVGFVTYGFAWILYWGLGGSFCWLREKWLDKMKRRYRNASLNQPF